jgi:putative SOS response-associated peptidase YedK
MCGRFTNRYSWRELHDLYRLTDARPNFPPRYNIAPTDVVPVVRRRHDGERELVLLRWGLIPYWAKDPKIGYSTINARAETIADKPAFKEAFRGRRCIVPASGFIEWQTVGKKKLPYHFRRPDHRPLSLAGLWERWSKGGEPVETFTIVVTEANDLVRPMHDRMPVVLADGDIDAWLDPDTSPAVLKTMLRPADEGLLVGERVSTRVNNVKNDDPECLAVKEVQIAP